MKFRDTEIKLFFKTTLSFTIHPFTIKHEHRSTPMYKR
ncbi:unnamed protein product, partial [marine sediment metagenome]